MCDDDDDTVWSWLKANDIVYARLYTAADISPYTSCNCMQ